MVVPGVSQNIAIFRYIWEDGVLPVTNTTNKASSGNYCFNVEGETFRNFTACPSRFYEIRAPVAYV